MKTNRSRSSILTSMWSTLVGAFESRTFRRALGTVLILANIVSSTGMVLAKEAYDESSSDTSSYVSEESAETETNAISESSSSETSAPAEEIGASSEETSIPSEETNDTTSTSETSLNETTEGTSVSPSTSSSSETSAESSKITETEAETSSTKASSEESATIAESSESSETSEQTSDSTDVTSAPEAADNTVLTYYGKHFTVIVTYGPETNIPSEAELQVREIISQSECDSYYGQLTNVVNSDSISSVRFFDISLMINGIECEPSQGTTVGVKILLDEAMDEAVSVVHLPDREEAIVVENEFKATSDGTEITFEADGFSAYAIVAGPDDVPIDSRWKRMDTVQQLREWIDEDGKPKAVYIGNPGGYYFTDQIYERIGKGNRTGIAKTFPSGGNVNPGADAVPFYFEFKTGSANEARVYCMDGDSKKYIIQAPVNTKSLSFTSDADLATYFTISESGTSKIFLVKGNKENNKDMYWNMQNGTTADSSNRKGYAFAVYDSGTTDANIRIVFVYEDQSGTDAYELDGKTFGLMDYDVGVAGKGLMANPSSGDPNALEAKPLTVMAKKTDNTDKLFVPKDSDLTMWTFDWIEENRYYLKTEIDGVTYYLNVDSTGTSVSTTPMEITVQPGVSGHKGQISLRTSDGAVVFSGSMDNGFTVGSTSDEKQWLNLVKLSALNDEYFKVYSARRVGVAQKDENDEYCVKNGTQVLIYTRVWNETDKRYVFFAVDHDGSLVPCFEDGNRIEWVGHGLNTLLWDFTEYYWEGTNDPNHYYELYNEYSEKYLAPQFSTDGSSSLVLWDEPVGINLDGRKDGGYFTTIQAWDETYQDYARLSSDGQKVISYPVPLNQAVTDEKDNFYFAIVQDSFEEEETHGVPTVDNNEFGIKMRMVNFDDVYRPDSNNERERTQTEFFGDYAYIDKTGTKNLLSTDLKSDGYPVSTNTDRSLVELYRSAQDVNHLFLESIYLSSGYFQFDSTQNFATLVNGNGDFRVFQELATVDSSSKPSLKHGLFLPYDDLDEGDFAKVNQYNLYDADQVELDPDDPRKYENLYLIREPDYYFGMEMETSFVQTPSGHDDWGHDIIYEFKGDDDFWLYVDGELLIDLGGIHRALVGTVNFATGEVVVNGAHTTIRDVFKKNYEKRGEMTAQEIEDKLDEIFTSYVKNGKTYWRFKDYTAHTMKVFYMERGGGSSNLYMRFNQASVKPGTVVLGKEIDGAEANETILAEFPYQIYYRYTEDGEDHLLDPNTTNDIYVHYKGTTNPVTHLDSVTIDGVDYDSVYYLKPGQECEIKMPDQAMYYYVVECGVDPAIYNQVFVNGVAIPEGSQYVRERSNGYKDYSIPLQKVGDRTSVKYVNHIDPNALRTLTFTKWLFEEDGLTQVQDDNTTFNFRLYLDFDPDETTLDPNLIRKHEADMYVYHVKDPNGVYCKWDVDLKKYVPLPSGATSYEDLTAEELRSVSIRTSIYGAISNIPAYYTVEVRDVLIGTKYLVEERPNEVPDGYSPLGYVFDPNGGVMDPTNYTAVSTVPYGQMEEGKDPHADIVNLKGYGFRMYKEWNDDPYMESRADAYFAIYYTDPTTQQLTLADGSVHRLEKGKTTDYWYFEKLVAGASIEDYVIREVKLTNPSVDAQGNVTYDGEPEMVVEDGQITIYGKQIGADNSAPSEYTVHYDEPEKTANVMVQRIKNVRSGFDLYKVDWDGTTPLSDASFKLEYMDGGTYKTIGTFTSNATGFVTTTFLTTGLEYRLTEVKNPQGFSGLSAPLTLVKQADGTVQITGQDAGNCILYPGDIDHAASLSIKNKPYEFTVIKVDEDGVTLDGAKFALYKQKKVGGIVLIDSKPMPGYEALVTGNDGVVPKLDSTLPAGTYELHETEAPFGYTALSYAVQFTVKENGEVKLDGVYDSKVSWAVDDSTDPNKVSYTMRLTNVPDGTEKLVISKTVDGNFGDRNVKFTFNVEFKNSSDEALSNETVRIVYSDGTNSLVELDANGCTTVQLAHGESVSIMGLQKTWKYTVTEMVTGYKIKCRAGTGSYVETNTISGIVTSQNTVDFVNSKNGVVPTGLDFSYRTIVGAILVLMMSGAAAIMLNRRKDDDDPDDEEQIA